MPPETPPPAKVLDPIAEWMLEMTASLERLSARVQAAEKSVDQQSAALAANSATAAAAASALIRIAKTEEDRLIFDRQLEVAKGKTAEEERLRSDQWLQRFWGSQAVQLLFLGVVLALLQYLGVSHMLSQIKGPTP